MNRSSDRGRQRAQRTTRDQYRVYVEFVEADPSLLSLKSAADPVQKTEKWDALHKCLIESGPPKRIYEYKKVHAIHDNIDSL